MPRVPRRLSTLILLLLPSVAAGQRTAEGRARAPGAAGAIELERLGRYAEAAELYRTLLGRDPTSVSTIMGLERTLDRLGRIETLIPHLDSALALEPRNQRIRSVELRVWTKLAQPEKLESAARRWIEADPMSAEPYRQWAVAVVQLGDFERAEGVLREGSERIGGFTLSIEMAQLAGVVGDWDEAVRHWQVAVRNDRSFAASAAMSLERALPASRDKILETLLRADPEDPVRLVAAELLVAWNRPDEGWPVLDRALPASRGEAVAVLRRFANRVKLLRTPEAERARGYALERVAELSTGAASERARIEAARAFAVAGDRRAAQRMLENIASDPSVTSSAKAGAMASLIGVMAESGRLEEAERAYREWSDRLSGADLESLRHGIAWLWVRSGELARAESILEADSTVAGFAVRASIALYRGDLRTATEYFRIAGPYAGTRQDATKRTEMMALLQRVEPDSVAELGGALLDLARGDTARAVDRLVATAEGLPPRGGRADLLLLAGRLVFESGDFEEAVPLLMRAKEADPEGPAAPAAEFQLARSRLKLGDRDAAIGRLENLILSYPESAVVPQARRLLDQVRGMIPRS